MSRLLLFVFTALLFSCNMNIENDKIPALDLTNIDSTYLPSEDFYEYATHGWQVKNPMKADFARYGVFDILRENNEIRLNNLFSKMTKVEAEKGSSDRKITDLYKMGLDSIKLNGEGVKPSEEDLKQIMGCSRESLPQLLGKLNLNVCSPFFAVGVDADLKNSDINTLYLMQNGLGMNDRDYYLDKEHEVKRSEYIKYLHAIFQKTGIAADNAEKVLALETKLAEKFKSNVELRDIQANYNPMDISSFKEKYRDFDWEQYFSELSLKKLDTLVIGQPETLDFIVETIKNEPIENIRAYIASQYLKVASNYMDDEIYSIGFEFFDKVLSGKEQQKPRWKRAMAIPNSVLSEAVGKMYVAEYFSESQKTKVIEIVKNLKSSLGEHIRSLEWMSDSTKQKALEKLDCFCLKIGYPDKWKDYSELQIDASLSYWENIKSAIKWANNDNLSELGEKVDREKWLISPQTINAYYNLTTNEICFPAAILQPPFYNPDADDAVNYGAIGVVIGHEMTHGFDDQGRLFDKQGNLSSWWSEKDEEEFKKRTAVLIDQFDSIEIMPGLNANGELSLGENIADQGGLRISYTAYKNSLNGAVVEPIDGFTADQRFYLSYATIWAQNIRKEEIERLTKVDVHSLGKNRVNATLKNIDTFYDAFNIKEGSAMYLPPEKRTVIW